PWHRSGRAVTPKDFALSTYLVTIGALFRLLDPGARTQISKRQSSHPHPAVRACLVGWSTLARGVFDGSFTASAPNEIVANSIGHLEEVWASLFLPGQSPEPAAIWGESVAEVGMALFESYGDKKPLLDQYARIPRRWDNWQWPETKELS
ncbi:MAG TPA: hypothetical protein VKA46_15980, partial [Gemmataceae bacterium]|nr:hypothetical protein [Gemmataceae bacterium]